MPLQRDETLCERLRRGRIIEAISRSHRGGHVDSEPPGVRAFVKLSLHSTNEPVVLTFGEMWIGRIVCPERRPLPQKLADRLPSLVRHAVVLPDAVRVHRCTLAQPSGLSPDRATRPGDGGHLTAVCARSSSDDETASG
jgi:hypothetical protein